MESRSHGLPRHRHMPHQHPVWKLCDGVRTASAAPRGVLRSAQKGHWVGIGQYSTREHEYGFVVFILMVEFEYSEIDLS